MTITYDAALEDLFERTADSVRARRQIILDADTRKKLLREIAEVVRLATRKLIRKMSGDYSEDQNVARFPAFEAPKPQDPAPTDPRNRKTMRTLFEEWKTHHADKRAASTIRCYVPSVETLIEHLGDIDIRLVTEDDIWAWAEKRRDKHEIAPRIINRNDLVALASVFEFATTQNGGRLVTSPVRGRETRCSERGRDP